ncbi:hypothetical protein ACA910_001068 [Epithemia clementina (nom. ined.)]
MTETSVEVTDMPEMDGRSAPKTSFSSSSSSGESVPSVHPTVKEDPTTRKWEANGVEEDADEPLKIDIPIVSWFQQLSFVIRKNNLLIVRRPLLLLTMLLSSMIFVLIAWSATNSEKWDFGEVPLDECGTVDWFYSQLDAEGNMRSYDEIDSIPISYNDDWRNGFQVALMGLGPMILGICAFLYVQPEIETKMLGVLRGLGLRESVYWVSWWIPFLVIALINALLAAATAKLIDDVHVFRTTSFGPIFVSFFFLNVGLLGSSFLTVAVAGGARSLAALLILIMLGAAWTPLFYSFIVGYPPTSASDVNNSWMSSPSGVFWVNKNTSRALINPIFDDNYTDVVGYTTSSCEQPVLSKEEAEFLKTPDERLEVTPNEYFIGCYFSAGFGSYLSTLDHGIAKFALMAIPYTQFFNIWGNFLGYTAMHNRTFGLEQLSMNAEALALNSIGPVEPNALTSLYGQGSTLSTFTVISSYDYNNGEEYYNCPSANLSDSFCEYLNQCDGSEQTESATTNEMIGLLIAFAALYTLLGAYWIQVFPCGNGAAQPFYFPLLPSYWVGAARPKRDNVQQGGVGVYTTSIFKSYGKTYAVNNVDVSMAVGEVTALLGHNGAGKTTLSHMLCCETEPSGGSASIFGLSPIWDKYIIRQVVGVCKQDDYLYPKLTAREHLELFAGLRGVVGPDIILTVQKWLESVDLDLVQNDYCCGFSGGMKRRLSVACSTIGDRPFIVLDEPTTGMDPVSRRFVWKHIDSIKEGRVVLLTTHAMEEADLLADTVMIMCKGQVAARGSPLELKKEHGSSLQFSLMLDQQNLEPTIALIWEQFAGYEEWVTIEHGGTGNVTVAITKIQEGSNSESDGTSEGGLSVDTLADFASFLESGASGVREYGFSNSSLEEVFLKVTLAEGGSKTQSKKEKEAAAEAESDPEAGENGQEGALAIAIDDQAVVGIGSYEPKLTVQSQFQATVRFMVTRDWTGRGSISNWVTHGIFLIASVLLAILSARSFDPFGVLTRVVFTISISVLTIVSPLYFERFSGLFYLTRAQGMLKNAYISAHVAYSLGLAYVFTFVVLSLVFATPLFRMPEICDNNYYSGQYQDCDWHYGDRQQINYPEALGLWNDMNEGERVALYARRSPGSYGLVLGIVAVFPLSIPGSVFASSYFPGYKIGITLATVVILCASLLPCIFYWIYSLKDGMEDLECSWEICNTTFFGNESTLNGADFLNCVGLEVNANEMGALCIPTIAGLLPQIGVFQGLYMALMSDITFTSDPPEYVEEKLIPMLTGDYYCRGTTCQFPFARGQYSGFVGFMILGAALLALLGLLLVLLLSFPGKKVLQVKSFFLALIKRVLNTCRCRHRSPSGSDVEKSTGLSEEVLDETEIVQDLVAPFVVTMTDESTNGVTKIVDYDAIPRKEIPPVVAHKLRKEYSLSGGSATKVALDSLDLHVPKGQVLGLLGKNGAGKSTALKIFAGGHEATSGVALVAGYDIALEQIQAFERLGNCEQFDVFWPWESVKVHLELFGGLKGLPKNRLKEIAHAVASSVGLGAPEVYNRRAGALSGGMRRRLSIAISLIGAPSVLLLDEPTTGLDPSTRNTIWDLIGSFATTNRAVIITTHMMLEADSLCNRIAIMAKGKLKTIGTQQWLKDTYGSGYLLQLNLVKSDEETQNRALDFVRHNLHPDATILSRQAKTLHIALPRKGNRNGVSLSEVFRVLYSSKRFEDGNINQFLFAQSSLEDVFIALGEE